MVDASQYYNLKIRTRLKTPSCSPSLISPLSSEVVPVNCWVVIVVVSLVKVAEERERPSFEARKGRNLSHFAAYQSKNLFEPSSPSVKNSDATRERKDRCMPSIDRFRYLLGSERSGRGLLLRESIHLSSMCVLLRTERCT